MNIKQSQNILTLYKLTKAAETGHKNIRWATGYLIRGQNTFLCTFFSLKYTYKVFVRIT